MTSEAASQLTLDTLPKVLLQRCLTPLPADARARCAAVCRPCRDALEEPAAWARLDLSKDSGVTCGASVDNLLRSVAGKARGRLASVDVSGMTPRVDTLLEVLAANADVRELRTETVVARNNEREYPDATGWLTVEDAEAALAVAHNLTPLVAPIRCPLNAAPPLLRRAPPFGALRLTRLKLTDSATSAAEAFAAHARSIAFWALPGPQLPPVPVAHCIAPLAEALCDDRSLTWLESDAIALQVPPEALVPIVGALTGHPTLRVLDLEVAAQQVHALCALVEADAPALHELRFWGCNFGDAELAPLLGGALAHNTHLRVLDSGLRGTLSEALTAEQVLPAVHAATALRELGVFEDDNGAPSLREAHALLRRREADAGRA